MDFPADRTGWNVVVVNYNYWCCATKLTKVAVSWLIVSLLGLIGVARSVARQLLMITMQDFQLSGAHCA